MSFSERPTAKETESDLLKLQEILVAGSSELAVKIKKTSHCQQTVPYMDPERPKSPPPNSPPVKAVQEQEAQQSSEKCDSTSVSPALSFEVLKSTEMTPPRKKSLFAQRLEKSRAEAKRLVEKSSMPTSTENRFGDHSYIIAGKDAEDIHLQNTERLSNLTLREIEEERGHLMSQLSSSSIKFLMSRRKNSESVSDTSPKISKDPNVNDLKTSAKTEGTKSTSMKKAVSSNYQMLSELSEKNHSEDLSSSLPINPNEVKQWLHMDIVEKEKLEWMKDLPRVKSLHSLDVPYSARFNFDGLLLPYNDESIEVNKGLHHHGEEPERPGYTLQELIQLSRSSLQQQRVLGLTTLGNVLLKFKLGIYDKVLQQNIMKELLDAGIFLILRFSMDDVSSPVVFAALGAMRNLLVNDPDEAALDFCLGCEGGLYQPILHVPYEAQDPRNINEQKQLESELKDFEIIQLDVIKGALRTNLITRLGYILDVLKGPPSMVLDVLIRIARHSKECAEAVVSCGGLLRTIRDELLTCRVISSLAASSGHTGYGEPSAKALRLMRVLAAHSRTIANTLLDKFNIMEPVMTYVSMSSPELPHIQSLVIGGYYFWQTLLSYGLASQMILDLFPILMRQLHFHAKITSAVGDDASTPGHELATALSGVIELAAIILNAGHSSLEAVPIFQLGKLLSDCVYKWFTQLSTPCADKPSWSCVKMMGAALSSLATLAKCIHMQDSTGSQGMHLKLESLSHGRVFPFLRSDCLQYLLSNLKPSSFLLSQAESGCLRDPSNLPSLGALEWGGESLVPCLLQDAPHPLLSGLLHYIINTHELFGSSRTEFEGGLLDSNSLGKYVSALVTQPLRSSNHWFSRNEVYLLCRLLAVVKLKPSSVPELLQISYCQLAFRVLDLIQANDRHLIASIFVDHVFNAQFIRWGTNHIISTQESLSDIIEGCISNLPAMLSIYGDILATKSLRLSSLAHRTTMTSKPRGRETALPIDWYYAPLLLLYGQSNAQERKRTSDGDSVDMVVSCLQLVLMTELLWQHSKRQLSVTARWCRLSLVFLAGADLFLDPDVKRHLQLSTNLLLEKAAHLNFSEEVPGLTTFSDLYGELLLQFSGVSYGDKLFGAFLLVPLQQNQEVLLRCMVWGEFAMVLRSLATPINEVGIPVKNYLEPYETDHSLLISYLEALAKGYVKESHCPLLYFVAVHHVAMYIKTQVNTSFAQTLRKRIEHLGNEELKGLLLNYDASTHRL